MIQFSANSTDIRFNYYFKRFVMYQGNVYRCVSMKYSHFGIYLGKADDIWLRATRAGIRRHGHAVYIGRATCLGPAEDHSQSAL